MYFNPKNQPFVVFDLEAIFLKTLFCFSLFIWHTSIGVESIKYIPGFFPKFNFKNEISGINTFCQQIYYMKSNLENIVLDIILIHIINNNL